jgi:hypothetical protein
LTSRFGHSVGEALEGVYLVYFGLDIGYLNLNDNQYSFTLLIPPEQIPQTALERLFFVRNPEGRYGIEYKEPVHVTTRLKDLNGFTFLALIRFSTATGANQVPSDSNRWGNDIFYICADQENKLLLFHSVYNELQQWGITKPWD